MKRKLAAILAISLIVSMSLSGCKKNDGELSIDDYKSMYNNKVSEVTTMKNELDSVKRLLYEYDPNLAEVADLSNFTILPTGEKAYVQLNSRITFSSKLDMGQSVVVPNQSKIGITNNVFFTPSENWTFSLGNGFSRMSHVNGIYGEVSVYSYNGQSNAYSVYDEIIKPHLEATYSEQLTKKVLFLGNNAGTMTESRILVINRYKKEDGSKTTSIGSPEEVEEVQKAIDASLSAEEVESTAQASSGANESTAETSEGETSANEEETTVASGEGQTAEVETSNEPVYQTNEAGEIMTNEAGEQMTVPEETSPEENEYTYEIIPYRYVCGVAIGDYSEIPDALVFQFFYPESANIVSSTEAINTMLKSVVMGGNFLTLE